MADTMIASSVKTEHNTRKNKKPLMEKRRRARINSCLSQLKSLVLQAIKKDSSQFSKLEKADILELTVKHLRALQRQQAVGVMTQDPNIVSKYRAGFNECAKEVVRYMGSVREVNEDIKDRVLGHLASCLQIVNHATPVESMQPQQQHLKSLHVQMPPQQAMNVGITSVPHSIILPTPQTSVHSGMSYTQSPERSPSSSPLSSNALSALSLQSAAASVTTAAMTLVSHNPAHISGAFKIVPSSVCPSGAVALYVGGASSMPHRTDTVSVDAVPLYSVALPHSEGTVTAFVPSSSLSASHCQKMSTDSRLSVNMASVKEEYHVNMAASSLPVDLRQTHKVKAFVDSGNHGVTFGQCSPQSLAEERLWRPW